MTRRQLADASGVTEVQIWNIESGKTLNPRAQTRERLADALGVKTPAETVEVTEEDAIIPEVGKLTDFDPHDDADLPEEPGLYVFYDISDRPTYVGESDNIKRRVTEHADKFWFKRPIVETAAYVRISDTKLRRQVESTLIRFLKSNAVINKQHVNAKLTPAGRRRLVAQVEDGGWPPHATGNHRCACVTARTGRAPSRTVHGPWCRLLRASGETAPSGRRG